MSSDRTGTKKSPEHAIDELLRVSYSEVLDATKHQDDKINRLLTAISFLTAGSIALANLDSARAVLSRFDFVDGSLSVSLALITLGAFLVGVVAAVVMLIGSLTTPLRFPGGSKPSVPRIRYVHGPRAGQLYFHEISSMPLVDWYAKWQRKPADLAIERRDSLIREIHNLAARTEFKYHKTGEAVAVVNFALYSLSLTAVLVLYSAGMATEGEVDYDWRIGALLAAVTYGYFAFAFITTLRNENLLAGETVPWPNPVGARVPAPADPESNRRRWRATHPFFVASFPAVLFVAPAVARFPLLVLLLCLSTIVLAVVSYRAGLPLVSEAVDQSRREDAAHRLEELGVPGSDSLPERSEKRRKQLRAEQAAARRGAFRIGCVMALAPVAAVWLHQPVVHLVGALLASLTLLAVSIAHSKTRRRSELDDTRGGDDSQGNLTPTGPAAQPDGAG